jgi:hypothetical protein
MTHESSMLERVAKAMQTRYVRGDELNFGDLARAAVEAMREPNEKMIRAGKDEWGWDGYMNPDDVWSAMITSILEGN